MNHFHLTIALVAGSALTFACVATSTSSSQIGTDAAAPLPDAAPGLDAGTVVTPSPYDDDPHDAGFRALCQPVCPSGSLCGFGVPGCAQVSACNPAEKDPVCDTATTPSYIINGKEKENKLHKVILCVTDHVKLEFFDLKGQLIYTLDDPLCHQTNLNEHLSPGLYKLEAYDKHGHRIVIPEEWDTDLLEILDH
ncbi:hypothetical protein BH09MYX1_BH09MYX1_56380 [soil metagenome]